ncbi:uncharacterized protein [Procambarus clarkii]|uniref:uncharacterized protein n=1 Tax=Procambarus clarkii TaxID=6728 RepID=UPI003742C1C7
MVVKHCDVTNDVGQEGQERPAPRQCRADSQQTWFLRRCPASYIICSYTGHQVGVDFWNVIHGTNFIRITLVKTWYLGLARQWPRVFLRNNLVNGGLVSHTRHGTSSGVT